jgi:hypothetical protein
MLSTHSPGTSRAHLCITRNFSDWLRIFIRHDPSRQVLNGAVIMATQCVRIWLGVLHAKIYGQILSRLLYFFNILDFWIIEWSYQESSSLVIEVVSCTRLRFARSSFYNNSRNWIVTRICRDMDVSRRHSSLRLNISKEILLACDRTSCFQHSSQPGGWLQ